MTNPVITITPGDPNGIGPEVVAKALADGSVQQVCTPVVVGSRAALDMGIEIAGAALKTRSIDEIDQAKPDPGFVDVLDDGVLQSQHIELGKNSAICGAANGGWLRQAASLSRDGRAGATVMAPVNSDSLALAKQDLSDVFGRDPSDR